MKIISSFFLTEVLTPCLFFLGMLNLAQEITTFLITARINIGWCFFSDITNYTETMISGD
jgi:hypothetical protein